MNKRYWLYTIVICFGLLLPSLSSAFDIGKYQVVQDSLQIDDSTVKSRHFDDLNNTYNDDDFVYEHSIESSGWWTRFKQWLNDFINDFFNFENREDAVKATDIALKIAGVILFLLVIYFIFRAVLNKEGKWIFSKYSNKNIIPVNDIESNIHLVDFRSLIQSAEKNNNYRLAIRYYYLWLLKDMTAAEIIDYDVEKTNSDYHNEIVPNSLKEEFSYTSYLYNYIWYGEFNVNENQFSKAKHAFINFLESIKA